MSRPGPSDGPRVVHVVQTLVGGGAETLVRGLCSRLAERGVAVSAVSIYDDGLGAAERAGLGFPVDAVGRRGRADLGFAPRLVAAIARRAPHVVHAHLHSGKYAGRIAALLAGVPAIVFTEHGDEAGGPLRFAVNRVLHARTARFVVFSESQRRAFAREERVPLERVVVIPNGVAEPPAADRAALRAELGIAPGTLAYYLPARMAAQKNAALALAAFAALPRAAEPARLVLAGTGALEPELRARAETLGIASRVAFLGFRPDAARLMRAMDVFVMPSLWERMPIALGEAMLAGVAVVTAPWEGVADAVRDGGTGFVSAGYGTAAFAAALARAADPALRAEVAARARRFALERFDLDAAAASHAELYARLAAGRA